MKKRINLLTRQQNFLKTESYFRTLRITTYITGIALIILIAVFYWVASNQKKSLDNLLNEEQNYLKYFVNNNKKEAEFIYFSKKKNQFRDFLKDDTRIVLQPYYKMLADSLSVSSDSSLIEVNINKDKYVQFVVGFLNYDSMNKFLSYVESKIFLDKFSDLSLNNFSALEKTKNDYKLGFSGKLKELDENKN